MKLKLGAQRDLSAFSKKADEIIYDSALNSSYVEGINGESNCISGDSSSLHIQSSPGDGMMIIDTDCSSVSASPSSDQVSTETTEQARHNNVSIIYFFPKINDSRLTSNSSCGEPISTENGFPASVSSSSSESQYRSEAESIQSPPVCELSE